MQRKLSRITLVVLTGMGLTFCLQGIWIPAKALLAQVLLQQAWSETILQGNKVKPWPWADTWPVARLRAPAQQQDLIVLNGQEGASLAFGPGLLKKGAKPGQPGPCILAGHRDTSFTFLQQIQTGDILYIEDKTGKQWAYKVQSVGIQDADNLYIARIPQARLVLITCYPFHAIQPGTSQRYVVMADLITLPPEI